MKTGNGVSNYFTPKVAQSDCKDPAKNIAFYLQDTEDIHHNARQTVKLPNP